MILEVAKGTHSAVLTIAAGKVLEDVHIGDSIAVNGVCLTVTSFDGETFTADVMHETLNRSSLAQCKRKSPVNLERAMPANGRFGGHIVAGHGHKLYFGNLCLIFTVLFGNYRCFCPIFLALI